LPINASSLRKNIYRLLDRVLRTGKPLEIERNGKRLKVVRSVEHGKRLERLVPHDCIKGDPEDLVHMDWSDEWNGGRGL